MARATGPSLPLPLPVVTSLTAVCFLFGQCGPAVAETNLNLGTTARTVAAPASGTILKVLVAPGDKVGVLHIAGTTIGDLMCFEVAYDGLVRSIVQDGGQVIVVQTNNATYAGTGQLDQQFAISRYRAIESGRQVVVASTDGISGFFDADGSVLSRSAVHTQVVLERQVTLATGITLGVRLGFWVDLLLSLAALALTTAAALGIRARPGRIAT